jgi:16S rRNA C1402 (ribose-2'-O) methylase RsmI
MALTNEQRKKIYLLSDTVLYPEAVALTRELALDERVRQLPKDSQIMGLLNVSKSATYAEVLVFINRHIERHVDEVFYDNLRQKLNKIQKERLQNEFELVIPNSIKREEDTQKKELMLLLAREFIQHIIAETGIQRKGNKSNG